MKENTIVESERAKLDFSFDTEENNKEEVSQKIEEISQQAGFNARISTKPVDSNDVISEPQKMDRRTRTRTGRTYAFNTKIKPEIYEKITSLSDQMSDEEGRYVSLAEIIERSIGALEESLEKV